MTHLNIVLTRFNLRTSLFRVDRNQNETLTPEWYQKRFQLFENLCLPSLLNQEEKNFVWLIFFDTTTPPEYRGRIDSYRRHPQILIVMCDGMENFKDARDKAIAGLISPATQYLVSTRIDNDDALHREYLKTVHRHPRV